MRQKSLVSVIIPVYNCEKYLADAINSVLSQTYNQLEVIVIDDGSIDQSSKVAQNFGNLIQYERQENGGIATARNAGIKLAKGDYLTFLDADDLWAENKLQLQIDAFNDNYQLDMVFGQVKQFHSPELPKEIKNKIYCPVESMTGYVAGTMMIKKESWFRVGEFQCNWQLGEFIDWYLKAQEQNLQSAILPDILLKRRLHKTNTGIQKRDSRQDYVRLLKASLDRRRANKKL